ncbi:hypothetical protein RRG08_034655 [Elysia crispata]|uniref:Ankyrin repeat protein n=1 Tax=Elysia crispata TaxID=231223 RepID=A0AAE1B377_9GAST|nr:hypothetical protein RRG08_034655 [Elysia crispata]
MEDEEDNMYGSKTIGDLQDTSTFSTRANNIDENSPTITSVSFEGTYDESNLLDNFYTAVKQGNLSLTKHFLNAILDQNKLSESFHRNVRKKEKSQTENENGQCNFLSELNVEKVFHIAAHKKHVPILQFLLKSLPFNNITTGSMLLEQALQLQNALLVKLVLDRGVSANEKVNGSYIRWGSFVMYTFPLHVATIAGDEEIVHMLICYGAQLDMCDTDGNTALMLACAGSNINVLQLLLKAGADINLTDFNDRSALVIAAALNKTDMISLIADHGGQISERMILRACEISSVSVFALKLLLRTLPNKGLYVDWYRLLDAATPFRKPEIVHELLNHMPASLKVPGKRAQDILINALRNKHHGEQITFTLLRENFIKVNIKNSEGEYPLHIAVQYCTFTLCSALASTFNADVNAKDKSGRTPLMMCLYRRRLEKDSTLTAASIMRHLIQQGADINAQDYEGRTSLHHAVMHDNQNAAAILIKAGAHVSICDEQGRSPLDIHWEDTFLCHSPIKNLGFLSGLNSNYFVKISLEKRMQIVTVLLEAGHFETFCVDTLYKRLICWKQ